MGFESPVYRMNIEEQKKLLTMKSTTRSQLRKGDRPWGGRLWEKHQAMNKNLIRGRRNGTSWHNAAKFLHSVPEVNEALGCWRFLFLSGDTSSACGSVLRSSAAVSNGRRDWRGVSRSHSSRRNEPECKTHSKVAGGLTRRRAEPVGRTDLRNHPPRRPRQRVSETWRSIRQRKRVRVTKVIRWSLTNM